MKIIEWVQSRKAVLLSVLGYLTAGAVLLAVFLYITFPWEQLSDYARQQAERMTASTILVQTSEVRFPLRLIWSGVVLSPRGMQRRDGSPVHLALDRVAVEWPLGPLLRRRMELVWSVDTTGGRAHGRMAMQPTEHGLQYRLEGEARELDLAWMIERVAPNEHRIEGRLDLSGVRHDWIGSDFLKGSGRADLSVTEARIGVLDLGFAQVSALITMKAGGARFDDFKARGPGMDLSGGGDILFRSTLSDSLINLNSRATIKRATGILSLLEGAPASGAGGPTVDLSLRGTFKRPTFYLNGVPMFTGPVL